MMKSADFAIYCDHTWIDGAFRPATVFIKGSQILQWKAGKMSSDHMPIQDASGYYLMPGLIDAHVHINEPGRTDWEGFSSATKAAAAGGITTVVDMPLNSSPVTTSAQNFQLKLAAAKDQLHVNCAFWGGFIPESLADLESLIQEGVMGIKVFLTHSGIDEFPNVGLQDLEQALPILKQYDCQILVHCELDHPHAGQQLLQQNPERYAAYLASRPRSWENDAVRMMIQLCRKFKVKTHIVHLSSSDVLAEIKAAKAEGLKLTVETCPQYLYFDAAQIPDRDTHFKCAPPIRERENNDLLWQALNNDLLDFIATDHSPAPPAIKQLEKGDFSTAWGGIAGLQCLLPVVWTAAKQRQVALNKIPQWLTEHPAKFLNLAHRKGKIEAGYDADLLVWAPEETFTLQANQLYHKHKISPYIGQTFYGIVKETYVQGKLVYQQGNFKHLNQGKIIKKEPSLTN